MRVGLRKFLRGWVFGLEGQRRPKWAQGSMLVSNALRVLGVVLGVALGLGLWFGARVRVKVRVMS